MMPVRAVLILLLLSIPAVATATDLHLSMDASVQYDNNAFRNDDVKEDDFSFRISPTVRMRSEIGKFDVLAKAGGVGASFRWFEGTPEFRFDTAGKGFDDGKLGDAVGA